MSAYNIAKILEGNWEQLEGKVKKHWGKLTDDDMLIIDGTYEGLIGKLKEIYGYTLTEAEQEVDHFVSEFGKLHRFKINNELFHDISDLLQNYRVHLQEFEESAISYVKRNPVKIVGAALVVGFLAGKIFKLKK